MLPVSNIMRCQQLNEWNTKQWWKDTDKQQPKYLEKTCPIATLSIKNPTWIDLQSNPALCCKRLANNHLSHDMAGEESICTWGRGSDRQMEKTAH